jgi:hypothetical protein
MAEDIPVTAVKWIRDLGKDEYWLQDWIYNHPSMLGLGDLERISKEKKQSSLSCLDH